MNREGRKRITLDLPEDIYKYVKHIAVERDTTATKYIVEAIVNRIKMEEKRD